MIMAVIYVSELALYNSLNVSYIVDQCIKKNHSAICRLVKHLLERCSFIFFSGSCSCFKCLCFKAFTGKLEWTWEKTTWLKFMKSVLWKKC